ncbi:2-hydroxyisoflavanone dehydratase-like [Rosa rugosa]|uniref:2-hydroxyisoflavanone dehydratase-like n=1 Tax=Rosa rugosa TaxID=74645 RepID=UPI002B40664A|nr:2-hydroxyisoflavanone dehydratase-like [Rosa rugosa]
MESTNNEVAREFRLFKVYKDGRVEKFHNTQKVPPSTDSVTGVQSKDVLISPEPAVSARIFLPKIHDPTQKLPILFYIHGGGFCLESAFSPMFHKHLTSLAAEANAIAVSVEYGLFPDRPIPACYDDSWAALKWVQSHSTRSGTDPWLNQYADFNRVFLGGDSGGANICHSLAVRVGSIGLPGVKVAGMVMVHPFFGGSAVDDEMWLYMCPENGGVQDRRLRPPAEDLAKLGCDRVLIFFAEKDHLRQVGQWYCDELKKSEWGGSVEVVEHEDVFHLRREPEGEKAQDLIKKFGSFIKQN